MIRSTIFLLTVFISLSASSQQIDGPLLLRQMHLKYYNGPCRSYTFSQKNTHYRNDSVTGTSVWDEVVEFPDKFRILFGKKEEGNFVIFRNDSAYNYRKNRLVKALPDSNTLLLLLGGMYYRDLNDVASRLQKSGYDFGRMHTSLWNGGEVYVVGAHEGDSTINQFWIDRKELKIVRIIERMNDKDIMDMRFEAHQPWCKGFVETRVSFRRNGKLEQVEEYYNIKEVKDPEKK